MTRLIIPSKLCRGCAVTVEVKDLKYASEQFQKFRQLYSALSGSVVHKEDGLPKLLCSACVTILELLENFQTTCSQSIDYIRELIVDTIKEELNDVIVTAEPLKPLMKVQTESIRVAGGMYKPIASKSVTIRIVKRDTPAQFRKVTNENSGDGTTPKSEKIIGKIETKGGQGTLRKVEHKRSKYKEILPKNEMTTFDDIEPLLKAYRKSKKNPEKEVLSLEEKPICHLCGKSFANITSIRNHMKLELLKIQGKRVRISNVVGCSYEGCERFFKNPEILAKHMKRHEDAKLSTYCSDCNRNFTNLSNYRRHLQSHHETPIQECHKCFANFRTARMLKAHILKSHSENTNTFVCETCGARYLSESELQKHTNRNHKSGKLASFLCQHCGKTFNTKRDMRDHARVHTELVYETCTICAVVMPRTQLTRHHRDKHAKPQLQSFKCKFCDKTFEKIELLNRHVLIHSGERPNVCHMCGMAFLRAQSLKRHLFTHSGERPIHCDICGKGLYSKVALRIHMNIHKRQWIAQGQKGIELMVYGSKKKPANANHK